MNFKTLITNQGACLCLFLIDLLSICLLTKTPLSSNGQINIIDMIWIVKLRLFYSHATELLPYAAVCTGHVADTGFNCLSVSDGRKHDMKCLFTLQDYR